MTQEQKAKAYDEAVKEAYIAYKDEDKHLKVTLERIFPEIGESDDERIRKDIIRVLKGEISFTSEKENEKYIAWLEKQGTSYTKRDVDDTYLKGISDAKNEKEKQYEANYQIRKDIATFIFNYRGDLKDRAKWMDYLGIKLSFVKEKQKPNKKIEPKFHEDDFIVNDYCMGKVIEVTNDAYLLDTGQGIPFSNEHNAHLWSIEDAKDGDVLACNREILLFKSYSVQDRISLYCWYNGQTNNFHNKEVVDVLLTTRNKVCPATKKQCDLLFSKMKEAGYEWDAEKKELKKIEDESENYKQQVMSEITYLVKDYISQKPTWTEEDERIRKSIFYALKYLEEKLSWDFLDDVDILDAYEWLEKLSNKV